MAHLTSIRKCIVSFTSSMLPLAAATTASSSPHWLSSSIVCTPIRFLASKSPGQSQKGFKRKMVNYSLLKNPGDRVDARTVLGTQKRLNYHPGLNVGINPRDKSLYAITAGTVYYSIERFVPNTNNPLVREYYGENRSDSIIPRYVKYVHVVPDKPTNEFRMIDLI